eukprot:6187858-Pleurochrysis_carterae.AAC.1
MSENGMGACGVGKRVQGSATGDICVCAFACRRLCVAGRAARGLERLHVAARRGHLRRAKGGVRAPLSLAHGAEAEGEEAPPCTLHSMFVPRWRRAFSFLSHAHA